MNLKRHRQACGNLRSWSLRKAGASTATVLGGPNLSVPASENKERAVLQTNANIWRELQVLPVDIPLCLRWHVAHVDRNVETPRVEIEARFNAKRGAAASASLGESAKTDALGALRAAPSPFATGQRSGVAVCTARHKMLLAVEHGELAVHARCAEVNIAEAQTKVPFASRSKNLGDRDLPATGCEVERVWVLVLIPDAWADGLDLTLPAEQFQTHSISSV